MRGTGIAAASVKEVMDMARQKPGALNFAYTNTSSQFAAEFFKRKANVQIEMVSYKSAPQALNDVVSGQIHFIFGDLASGAGLARAGRLVPLAVASSRRLSSMVKELGIQPE
jgi:tripartite-type tricarboxylate transporter receptor subunit TctC